jgi:hypothetical protein
MKILQYNLANLKITFYVSGCLLIVMSTSFEIEPTNNSVLFLKEKNVILIIDHWRVAIDLDTRRNEAVIFFIRRDLMILSKQQREFIKQTTETIHSYL